MRNSKGFFARSVCRRFLPALVIGWLLAVVSFQAEAQNRQCGDYVEAYKGGPLAYGTYLKATADVAKSRDEEEGGGRYSKALQASSAPSNALWLNNWCTKNPLRGFSEASNRLLDELTGQGEPAVPAAQAPMQIVVAVPPPPPQPSACRVGDVGECRGCSATCGNGSQAKCVPGQARFSGECAFQAECGCKFSGGAKPQPTGVSSCRVGDVQRCSGCSVTCSDGQTPVCTPGQARFGGDCAFQAECSCK